MTSSGHDFGYSEKDIPAHSANSTPIARGYNTNEHKFRHDEEHTKEAGRRKSSIIEIVKDNYGLTGPPQHQLSDDGTFTAIGDQTHRMLKPRHIQLIGIGGTIGTALYVQIGRGLLNGGPGSLFLAFTIWSSFILAVTNCKIVPLIPLSSDHSNTPALSMLCSTQPKHRGPKQATMRGVLLYKCFVEASLKQPQD